MPRYCFISIVKSGCPGKSSAAQLYKALKDIDHKRSADSLKTSFLKVMTDLRADPITHIINLSVLSVSYSISNIWKAAYVLSSE